MNILSTASLLSSTLAFFSSLHLLIYLDLAVKSPLKLPTRAADRVMLMEQSRLGKGAAFLFGK